MNARVDKLDAAVEKLMNEQAKAHSSRTEGVKPAAKTEEPEAKEEKSSSEGPTVSYAPVKQVSGTAVARLLRKSIAFLRVLVKSIDN